MKLPTKCAPKQYTALKFDATSREVAKPERFRIAPKWKVRNMSTECNRIAHQLASTINGNAWYGDSLQKMLNDVTAKQAQARDIPSAHSIWELLCHVDAWVNFTLGAVHGVPISGRELILRSLVRREKVLLLAPGLCRRVATRCVSL